MPIAYGCIVQLHLLGEHTFKVKRGEQLFRIGQRQAYFTFFFNRYFCIRVIKFYQFASGEGKRSTRRALGVSLVTRTLLPCAKRCPIRLAIVWVLPVPGGPWTSTALFRSRRRAISSCSALAGLLKRICSSSPLGASNICCAVSVSSRSLEVLVIPTRLISE